MTPEQFAAEQREFVILTEKQSAILLLAEFRELKSEISQFLTTNLTGTITIQKITENAFLERALDEIDVQIERITNPFSRIVTRGQQRVINFAARALRRFLEIESDGIFSVDQSAVQKLIGRTQSGTSLSNFFRRLKIPIREKAKAELIEGFALGESSRKIAKRINDVADTGLARALGISRDSTVYAYRSASIDFYKQTKSVSGYRFMSSLDVRTCIICWRLHGKVFKLKHKPFVHYQCRCVITPVFADEKNSIQTGIEQFNKLEKGYQKQILGNKRFELFENGNTLQSFISMKESKEFGEIPFIKPLADLISN